MLCRCDLFVQEVWCGRLRTSKTRFPVRMLWLNQFIKRHMPVLLPCNNALLNGNHLCAGYYTATYSIWLNSSSGNPAWISPQLITSRSFVCLYANNNGVTSSRASSTLYVVSRWKAFFLSEQGPSLCGVVLPFGLGLPNDLLDC